jgi:hypothetical protein
MRVRAKSRKSLPRFTSDDARESWADSVDLFTP